MKKRILVWLLVIGLAQPCFAYTDEDYGPPPFQGRGFAVIFLRKQFGDPPNLNYGILSDPRKAVYADKSGTHPAWAVLVSVRQENIPNPPKTVFAVYFMNGIAVDYKVVPE